MSPQRITASRGAPQTGHEGPADAGRSPFAGAAASSDPGSAPTAGSSGVCRKCSASWTSKKSSAARTHSSGRPGSGTARPLTTMASFCAAGWDCCCAAATRMTLLCCFEPKPGQAPVTPPRFSGSNLLPLNCFQALQGGGARRALPCTPPLSGRGGWQPPRLRPAGGRPAVAAPHDEVARCAALASHPSARTWNDAGLAYCHSLRAGPAAAHEALGEQHSGAGPCWLWSPGAQPGTRAMHRCVGRAASCAAALHALRFGVRSVLRIAVCSLHVYT